MACGVGVGRLGVNEGAWPGSSSVSVLAIPDDVSRVSGPTLWSRRFDATPNLELCKSLKCLPTGFWASGVDIGIDLWVKREFEDIRDKNAAERCCTTSFLRASISYAVCVAWCRRPGKLSVWHLLPSSIQPSTVSGT